MILISIHGAGGSGKTTFLSKVQLYQRDNIKNTVFLETASGLASASSIIDKRPILLRILNPKFSVETNLLKIWTIRMILFMMYIMSLIKTTIIPFSSIFWLILLLLYIIISYTQWLFSSVFLQSVCNYEKLQHTSVMNKIKEINKIELIKKQNWIWEDRNCIDAYSYITLHKAVVNDTDFKNTLLEHTQQLSCGIWIDSSISLICSHHLKRAQESKSIFGYLISKLMATFPSIFVPTITAVETVKEWYLKNDIPFIQISEWIIENKNNITDYNIDSEEISWNNHNLALLFSSIELLIKKNN
jgi:hypothetical protein